MTVLKFEMSTIKSAQQHHEFGKACRSAGKSVENRRVAQSSDKSARFHERWNAATRRFFAQQNRGRRQRVES